MKRFSFCDSSSLPLLFPYQPQSQSQSQSAERREMMGVYGGGGSGFQAMLEGPEEEEDMGAAEERCRWGKKRRLRAEQVGALERVFEEDNKLEPERKVRIAGELGLQPRQVAVWFQNRRARFKTKQLQRDFHLLKADYDSLSLHFHKLQQQRDALLSQLKGLKEKLLSVEEKSGAHHHHHHHHLPPPPGRNCGGEGSSSSESGSSGGGSNSDELVVLDYSSFDNLQQPLMAASRSSAIDVQQQQPQCGKMEAEQQLVLGGGGEECCNNNNNSFIFSLDDHPPPNLYCYFPTTTTTTTTTTTDHYSYQ